MKRRADEAGQHMTGQIKAGKSGADPNDHNIVRRVTGPFKSNQILTKSNAIKPVPPEPFENTALGGNGPIHGTSLQINGLLQFLVPGKSSFNLSQKSGTSGLGP